MTFIHVISAKAKHINDDHWFTLGYLTSEEAEEIKAKLEAANPDSQFTIDTYGVKGEYMRKEYGASIWLAVKYGKRRAAHAYSDYNECTKFVQESECDCVDPLFPFNIEMWEKNNWKKGKWVNF